MATPAVTISQFLSDIPELDTSNVTDPALVQIPKSAIQYWLNIALAMVNVDRWGGPTSVTYIMGVEMFTAHNVVLEALAQRDMDMAGIPGIAVGAVAGKSSGDVQISYDTASVLEMDGGHWNYSIFGKRFLHAARMFGAGGLQIGTPGCSPALNGPGWSGIWDFNFPNPNM
jgi:hypothetical protein